MKNISPLREHVNSRAATLIALKNQVSSKPELKTLYNQLCDELTELNNQLKDEHEGAIAVTWQKFGT